MRPNRGNIRVILTKLHLKEALSVLDEKSYYTYCCCKNAQFLNETDLSSTSLFYRTYS